MGLGLTQYIPFVAYCVIITAIFFTLVSTPRIGIYMITLLLPMQNLLMKLVIYPSGKDLMDILFVSTAIGFYIHRKKIPALKKSTTNLIIFLLIPATYTSLWVGSFKLGFDLPISYSNPQLVQWKNFIMMPILYFMVLKTVENKKEVMFLTLIMACTVLILDVHYYDNTKWVSHEHFSWGKRTAGTTFDMLGPNEIAAFYTVTAMFFIGLGLCEKVFYKKALFLGTACFNFYAILYLYSRGAYAAAVAGLLFFGIIKKRLILVILLVLFLGWQTILPQSVVERITMTDSSGEIDTSSLARLELWAEAIKEIKINPITGIGFGGTSALGFKTSNGQSRKDVHNGYVEILLEQGIIGILILLGILYHALKNGWLLFRYSDDDFLKGLGLGLIGMTIAAMVGNCFGDRWTYLSIMGYFWIIYAMAVKVYQIYPLKAEAKDEDKAGASGSRAISKLPLETYGKSSL